MKPEIFQIAEIREIPLSCVFEGTADYRWQWRVIGARDTILNE